ncbi:MAG: CoB--CoM heterodisulfide reductase iron-sulfur subunit B family protein [Planctomycetota bacterium]|nr:CoB--CoM heterodisulfide reductase iron-sulfur subunit B family protein [Planctomycetota bacterium]
MKIGYYPGCSLSGGGVEFDLSIKAIAPDLDLELPEIKDWSCCGATAAHNLNHKLAVSLPARVLALAAAQGLTEIFAPCAACYSRLAAARIDMAKNPDFKTEIEGIIEKKVDTSVRIYNVNELLREKCLDRIKAKAKPLKDLKVACYYGCLLVRPPDVVAYDDPEVPVAMDEVVKACGATPVDWTSRTDCCGGGFSVSKMGAVLDLSSKILQDAMDFGANCIITGCPMCHSNLDMRQLAINSSGKYGQFEMPILYITELVGLALGKTPKELGMTKHFSAIDKGLALAASQG